MLRALLISLVLLAAVPAQAGPIFHWVDARGDLHITDELAEVPEPFQSMYRAKLRALEEARRKAAEHGGAPADEAPAQPAPPPPPPASDEPRYPAYGEGERSDLSPSEREAERRKYWKALVAEWRAQLSKATEELVRLDQQIAEIENNPRLAVTPVYAAELVELRSARRQVLSRVEEARRMLVTELPARAKRELVPPAWLQ